MKTHTPQTQTKPHQPQTSPAANDALGTRTPKPNRPKGAALINTPQPETQPSTELAITTRTMNTDTDQPFPPPKIRAA